MQERESDRNEKMDPGQEEWDRYHIEVPDCEGCVFNFGNLHCAVYDRKPMDVVIAHHSCEKRKQGGTTL